MGGDGGDYVGMHILLRDYTQTGLGRVVAAAVRLSLIGTPSRSH
jgi:hypothetical protein